MLNRLLIALVLLAAPGAALAQGKPLANDQSITVLTGVSYGPLGQPSTPVDPTHPLPVQLRCQDAVTSAWGSCSMAGGALDTVIKATSIDRGGIFGITATQLLPANPARRGFSIQVQSASASCYISGQAAATADYHSLQIVGSSYYETPGTHVGTSTVSIICTAPSTSVYAREW